MVGTMLASGSGAVWVQTGLFKLSKCLQTAPGLCISIAMRKSLSSDSILPRTAPMPGLRGAGQPETEPARTVTTAVGPERGPAGRSRSASAPALVYQSIRPPMVPLIHPPTTGRPALVQAHSSPMVPAGGVQAARATGGPQSTAVRRSAEPHKDGCTQRDRQLTVCPYWPEIRNLQRNM